jgi:hypothetical protein
MVFLVKNERQIGLADLLAGIVVFRPTFAAYLGCVRIDDLALASVLLVRFSVNKYLEEILH